MMDRTDLYHSCAFTGHRPEKLPWGTDEKDPRAEEVAGKIKGYIEKLHTEKGVVRFVSGMAEGTDMMAAEAVLELKKQGFEIFLECAVPDEDFVRSMPAPSRNRYLRIISASDGVTFVCEEPDEMSAEKRNRYLADSCQYLIGVFSGEPGGTAYTLGYAKSLGRNMIIIDPVTMKIFAAGGKK